MHMFKKYILITFLCMNFSLLKTDHQTNVHEDTMSIIRVYERYLEALKQSFGQLFLEGVIKMAACDNVDERYIILENIMPILSKLDDETNVFSQNVSGQVKQKLQQMELCKKETSAGIGQSKLRMFVFGLVVGLLLTKLSE